MLTYPDLNPIALAIGPLKIHWYGLMYLVGFSIAWGLGRKRCHSTIGLSLTGEQMDDLTFYCVVGTIIGGRLGYMFFYGWAQILDDPLNIFKVWEGGMSFHGGLIGVVLAIILFTRRQHLKFFQVTDFVAPLIPPGLGAGRIGNFINGELWGSRTDLPWGMQLPCQRFPNQCSDLTPDIFWSSPVHASQIYEAILEGMVLFIILWWFSAKPRPRMAVTGLFLMCYGVFRCLIEFVRLPDAHIGYLAFNWLTMGQILSLPMIFAGGLCLAYAYRTKI